MELPTLYRECPKCEARQGHESCDRCCGVGFIMTHPGAQIIELLEVFFNLDEKQTYIVDILDDGK